MEYIYHIRVNKYDGGNFMDCRKTGSFGNKREAIKMAHKMCKELHEYKENIYTHYLVYGGVVNSNHIVEISAGYLQGEDRRWNREIDIVGKYI